MLGLISSAEGDPASDIMCGSGRRIFGQVAAKELLRHSGGLSRDAIVRNSGIKEHGSVEVIIVQVALKPWSHEPRGGGDRERVRGRRVRGGGAEAKRAVAHGLRGYPGGPANAVDVHLQLGGRAGRPRRQAVPHSVGSRF